MSRMGLLEQTARNSAAVSALNSVRHLVSGRSLDELPSDTKAVIREALEFSSNQSFERALLYSFSGLAGSSQAYALELGDSFKQVLCKFSEEDQKTIREELQRIVELPAYAGSPEAIAVLSRFLSQTIHSIGSANIPLSKTSDASRLPFFA